MELIPSADGHDVFEIESQGNHIVLRGNNGVAVASALNWYLKYHCQCHYSLKGRQMRLPDPLPPVAAKERHVSQDRWRYFLNYCCFGYSLPWFQWPDWERLIDWMALNGVNAPLSVTGQEARLAQRGQTPGLHRAEMTEFFAGPPYLPFGWMGCLDGFGGPLPADLGGRSRRSRTTDPRARTRIGNVPDSPGVHRARPTRHRPHFPEARLHQIRWAEWKTSLLDPLDPLFGRFAEALLAEQQRFVRHGPPLRRRHLHRNDAAQWRDQFPGGNRPRHL